MKIISCNSWKSCHTGTTRRLNVSAHPKWCIKALLFSALQVKAVDLQLLEYCSSYCSEIHKAYSEKRTSRGHFNFFRSRRKSYLIKRPPVLFVYCILCGMMSRVQSSHRFQNGKTKVIFVNSHGVIAS